MIEETIDFLETLKSKDKKQSFYVEITNFLTQFLNVDYAFIDLYFTNRADVETIALSHKGEKLDNIQYDLAGTPCADVLNSSQCLYCSDVQEAFPHDQMLIDLDIEAYAGAPTYDSEGNVNGLVGVMHTTIFDEKIVNIVLKLVAHTLGIRIDADDHQSKAAMHEARQEKTLKLLNHMGKTAKIGGWEMDVDTGELTWTDETFTLFEVEPNPNKKPILSEGVQLYTHEHQPVISKAVDDAIAHGTPFDLELIAQKTSGQEFWVHTIGQAHWEDGRVKSLSGTVRDIDRFKRNQIKHDNLRSIEKAGRKALDRHAIVSTTDLSGNIIFVNDNFVSISGYSREELIGSNHNIVQSGEHSRAFYSEMYGKIARGESWQGIFKNKKKSGEPYWVRSTISPSFDENGKQAGYISIRTDITPQMKAMDDYIAENAQKDEFISNISHEIKTPLNGINGYATMLELTDQDAQQREYIQVIKGCVSNILDQLNNLSDLQRLKREDFSTISIKDVCEECIEIIKPSLTIHNLTLEVALEDMEISAGHLRMASIVQNLLSNAVKYNRQDGIVSLKTKINSNKLEIWVKNTGAGISSDQYSLIFEPFKRGKFARSNIQGSGIGLAVVRQAVNELEGIIDVASDGETFAEFKVTLPIKKRS